MKLKPGATNVGFLVVDEGRHQGRRRRPHDRRHRDRRDLGRAGQATASRPRGPTAATRRRTRPRRSSTTTAPTATTTAGACTSGPARPTPPTGPSRCSPPASDAYGVTFEVPLADGATALNYIIHKGDEKDLPNDQLARPRRRRPRGLAELPATTSYLLPQAGSARRPRPDHGQAQWIDRDTVACATATATGRAPTQLRLRAATAASPSTTARSARRGPLAPAPGHGAHRGAEGEVPAPVGVHRLHRRPPRPRPGPRGAARPARRHRARRATAPCSRGTGVQTAGVLDDALRRKAAKAPPRPGRSKGGTTLSVWAPTAHVGLARARRPHASPMRRDDATGVWSVTGRNGLDTASTTATS